MSALYLREDFESLLDEAARFHGIPDPAFVEKDYYVTEALRAVASGFGDHVIFKGGTSLSKGWSLIHRFSEDIDLYVHPGDRGEKARNTLLKAVANAVGTCPALSARKLQPHPVKGVARATVFEYRSATYETRIENMVIVRAGIQSGIFPTEVLEIRSLLAEFLASRGVGPISNDMETFKMNVLHYRRTFVEKLFALHDKVARGVLAEGGHLGRYARHYYDVSQLLPLAEVQAMLNGPEYREIAADYHRLTSSYFPNQLLPAGMNLHESPALFPDAELKAILGASYLNECEILCYGSFPSYDEVINALSEARSKFQIDLLER